MGTGAKDMDGYEYVWGEERMGRRVTGIKIFVRGSSRVLTGADRKLSKEEWHACYDGAKSILGAFEMQTALLDPELAAKREAERKGYANIFTNAGLAPFHMRELPNGYCSEACCIHLPWFKVTSEIGPVTIGWRKRVINIDWTESDVWQTGDRLFPDERVTKGGDDSNRFIHAWGEADAVKYLAWLKVARNEPKPKKEED